MYSEQSLGITIGRFYRKYFLPWKHYILTGIVLLISSYLAFWGTTSLFIAILAAFAGIIFAVYLYRNQQHGLLLLVFASYLVPFTIGTGTSTSINATILLIGALTGLWIFEMFFVNKAIRLPDTPTIIPLLLIIVVSLLAFLSGQLPWFSFASQAPILAQVGGLMMFVLSIVAFILVVHLADDTIWLKRMVWLFLGIGALYILTRFSPSLIRLANRTFAYGSTAALYWLWMVVLAGSQAFFNTKLTRPVRAGLFLLLALTLYFSTIVAYDWKSGWVPPLAALLTMIWIGAPKLRFLALPAAGLLLLLNVVDISSLISGNEDYSVLTRVEAWRILLEIIKVNPILGLGPSNYYFYTPLYSILGYSVSFNSHNNYIDIVAQIGIFGLIFFIWFFWLLTKIGLRLLKTAPEGFERAYVIGSFGGIVGMLVAGFLGDWLIPFVYNVGLVGFRSSVFGWIFLGGLVALDKILQKQSLAENSLTAQK
jgi:O-antigen ligase